MPSIRILLATTTTSPGGGAVHVMSLARALAAREFDVGIAAPPGTPVFEWAAPDGGEFAGTRYALRARGPLDPFAALRLRTILRKNDYDVLHVHASKLVRPAAWVRRLPGGKPTVFTPHFPLMRRRRAIYRWHLARLDRFLAVSLSMHTRLQESCGVTADRVATIPHWLDTARIDAGPRKPGAASRTTVAFGVVGSITPRKGQEEFLEAGRTLFSQGAHETRFVIAGVNKHADKRYLKRLERLAEKPELAGRVRFLPWQDPRRVLEQLDVVVVPSWAEAFSLAALEGLAAGLPVIATDAGGPKIIVRDGKSGLLVPPRDVDALAEAMQRLLDSQDLRDRLGAAGASDVVNRFSEKRALDAYVAMYAALSDRV
ncbi:MAG: glycosyltransferase family 4 protein [Planctomycetota bacterium]